MAIHVSAEYHDGIAPTAFYPKKNPMKIATGPAGALGAGGWSIDTWATVVQISVAKSDGTWESQVAAPLGGFIPSAPVAFVDSDPTRHRWRATWTNTTALYAIHIETEIKIAGVWTADWSENTAVAAVQGVLHNTRADGTTAYVGGNQVRFRCRYTNAGIDGDWSDYSAPGIIPS